MKIALAYWSMSGNTEAAANYIESCLNGHEVVVYPTGAYDGFNAQEYDALIFGCPAMGAEVLEENEFDPFFTSIETTLNNKTVALFGSYGWGDGQWMRDWQDRAESDGANVVAAVSFNGPMDGNEAELDALVKAVLN